MAKKNNNSSPPPSEASGADLSMLFSISETIKEQIGLKSRVLEIDRTALNISKKITEASQNQNKGLESSLFLDLVLAPVWHQQWQLVQLHSLHIYGGFWPVGNLEWPFP